MSHAHATIIATSTFDNPINGVDGWSVFGTDTSNAVGPAYFAAGGNPNGYIGADDGTGTGWWYWGAPANFLGNVLAVYGQTLSFDSRQTPADNPGGATMPDVWLIGAGLDLAFNLPSNPGTDWTSYTVPLLASAGWRLGTNVFGPAATEAQLQSVLANLSDFRIRGEYQIGQDTGSLDNVVLGAVPEPSTFLLTAFAVAALSALRNRRGRAHSVRRPTSPSIH